jgi:hypothetical protein
VSIDFDLVVGRSDAFDGVGDDSERGNGLDVLVWEKVRFLFEPTLVELIAVVETFGRIGRGVSQS